MLILYLLILLTSLVAYIFVILFFIAQIVAAFTIDAPFVPVPRAIEDKIIDNLRLDKDSVLYDLGCGDGRVLKKAKKKYPDIKAVGIEIAIFPYFLARLKTRKIKGLKIKRGNIFESDVSNATHIFTYLYPKVMEKLLPILENKCKSGTRIVSCDFEDKNLKPTEIIELEPLAKRGKRLIVYTL